MFFVELRLRFFNCIVGIVRSRTKATEFFFFCCKALFICMQINPVHSLLL